MSFHQDKQKAREWKSWVRTHEERLIAIGIPREVGADSLTWGRFVEHGYHPPDSNSRDVRFRLEDLNEMGQHQLFELLRETLSGRERIGCTLWTDLHSRFGSRDPYDGAADA